MALDEAIDRLYALPLGQFVAARNELARSLRAGGDRQGAAEVKALAKPSVTAWAVNRLWYRDRAEFDRLLAAGRALRSATEKGGPDRQSASRERRRVLSSLVEAALGFLADAGHPPTRAARRRISHTLEAVSALDPGRLDPPPGRLTRDLEPQGFDALAALAPSPAPAARPTRARPSQKGGAARKKRAGPTALERRIRKAAAEVKAREAALKKAERQAAEAARALERSQRQAEAGAARAEAAEARAREAADRAAAAESAASQARRAASRARAAARRSAEQLAASRRRLERLRAQG